MPEWKGLVERSRARAREKRRVRFIRRGRDVWKRSRCTRIALQFDPFIPPPLSPLYLSLPLSLSRALFSCPLHVEASSSVVVVGFLTWMRWQALSHVFLRVYVYAPSLGPTLLLCSLRVHSLDPFDSAHVRITRACKTHASAQLSLSLAAAALISSSACVRTPGRRHSSVKQRRFGHSTARRRCCRRRLASSRIIRKWSLQIAGFFLVCSSEFHSIWHFFAF